jgi:hypothetical protein
LKIFHELNFFSKKWNFGLKFWSIFPTTWNMFHQNNGLFHQMEVQFIKLKSMNFIFESFFHGIVFCYIEMKTITSNWALCPLTSIHFHQIDICFHILEQCYCKLFHQLCFQLLLFSFTYFRFFFSCNWIFVILNWRLFHQIEFCFIYSKSICTRLGFASPNIEFFP